jgi:hypothetical protein
MAAAKNGQHWAIEFAGDTVRLCRFRVAGERVAVEECATYTADDFSSEQVGGRSDASILCAVPRSEVLLKPFVLPRGGGVDMSKVAGLKLEQSVAGADFDTMLWGCVEEKPPGGDERSHVLAAAISQEFVNGLLERHFPDSQRPAVVECSALSAVRAHVADRDAPAACEILIDCAHDGLSVFVLRGGTIDSTHLLSAGQPLEAAVNEIQRLILFLRGRRGSAPVEAVTCLGGERAQQLAKALRALIDIPVGDAIERTPAWLEGSEVLPADWASAWHRIQGLIELARSEDAATINFLAKAAPRRATRSLVPALDQLGTPALALVLVALLVASVLGQRALAQRRDALMTRVINRGRALGTELERREQSLAILKRYDKERYSLVEVFAELYECVPKTIKLNNLTMLPDGKFSVTGYCKKLPEPQEFAHHLNESEIFHQATTTSERVEGKKVTFKTTFSLRQKPKRKQP